LNVLISIEIAELLLKKFYERKAEILETLASETGRKLDGVLNRLEQKGSRE
jgi:hypothetical protein